MTIQSFRGIYRFLSNFYPCKILYMGIEYPSSEHAFQAAKTHDPLVRQRMAEMSSPAVAKRVGRIIPLRTEWKEIRLLIMEEILRIKFSNPALCRMLLSTKTHMLIEGNSWGDKFWGV